ncbi:hypothetical protein GCM10020331_027210 [Ectobacillus funiculus]
MFFWRLDMLERPFEVVSSYSPQGDQPKAIQQLTEGIRQGKRHQVLLGATGTGKKLLQCLM